MNQTFRKSLNNTVHVIVLDFNIILVTVKTKTLKLLNKHHNMFMGNTYFLECTFNIFPEQIPLKPNKYLIKVTFLIQIFIKRFPRLLQAIKMQPENIPLNLMLNNNIRFR